MRKTILALTMAASVLALSACSDKEEVIVSSKAGDITKNDLYTEMKDTVGEQALQQMVIEKVLDAKYDVSDETVNKEFEKEKEKIGDNFDQYLAQQGQTEESLKKILRFNLLTDAALADGIEVTDEELEKRAEMMNTELNARHVLVADEETALEVKKKLEDGADFAEIAKEYSTEEAAQVSGGDLGWFGYGGMVEEFQNGAYALELNTISDPVQSGHGFHIIEVTDKRDIEGDKVTVEDESVRQSIALEKVDQSTIVDKIAALLKEADVKIKDEDLKSALAMFADAEPAEEDDEEKEEEENKK